MRYDTNDRFFLDYFSNALFDPKEMLPIFEIINRATPGCNDNGTNLGFSSAGNRPLMTVVTKARRCNKVKYH